MDNKVIAVIDIGSNSIRLQVSRIIDKTYKVINEHKATVRIGDNVYKTGTFSEEAIETLLQVLSNMKNMMDSDNVEVCRAVATASFRDASNGEEVARIIKEKTGIEIEIISGIEEARLMYLAASYYFQMNEDNVLLVDMGGGSTEFSFIERGNLVFSESTPLGCSKLTYEYLKGDPPSAEKIKALKRRLKTDFDNILPKDRINKVICSGGTLGNVSFIYNKRNNLSDSAVKFVDSVFLKHFINEISGKKINDRLKISGMEPARADIILSAALLAGSLMNRYQLDGFYTLSGGLRAGLTIDVINKTGIEMMFQGGGADVRYTRLIETGKKYYFDERHALQTARLAKILFDNLKTVTGLEENDRHLLEAAAILHDTGQHIAYAKHHKHSYYLIMNTELPGFSDEEKTIIANIARYHRRSMPKKTHDNLQNLSARSIEKIEKLSAIMRVADALDRTHGSIVKDIKITFHDDTVSLEIIADGDTSMEINGLHKKKDLLEKILGREVTVI